MAGRDWRLIARRLRGLGPLGVTLAVVVGAVLLLGSGGVGSGPTASPAQAAQSTKVATRAPLRIARADAHGEFVQQGKDLEWNLALSQTQNDCQAPLNGGVCLRYSVLADEQAVMAGYGVIPASDVTVTAGAIVLRVDTRKTPGFVNVVGSGALIVATWKTTATAAKAGVIQRANVLGAIGTYSLPSATTSAASSGGASVIATMILR